MKKEKAVTLIALIVTIIILLILAGVTISIIIGDNGILTKATQASEKSKEETAKNEVQMAWVSCEMEYQDETIQNQAIDRATYYTKDNMNEFLKGTGKIIEDFTYVEGSSTRVKYESYDQGLVYEFIIDENGNITTVGD